MRPVDLIERKRDGFEHTPEEIAWLIEAVMTGAISEAQLAAWLMAVVWRGMTPSETAALTLAMAESGRTADLSQVPRPWVDKHSTGGVGDKTTLVVGPLAASLGMTVAKMSGRGLGHTGGTIDKLESIPGFRTDLSEAEFVACLQKNRVAVVGQTRELAPADGKLYALRDVTGTVQSIPLIASSIMSKKLAGGAQTIVLDVKVGQGAFMKTREQARQLAAAMVDIGRRHGRRVVALLTDMAQPLGRAVGNALEVREAIDALSGHGPDDLRELAATVVGHLAHQTGLASTPEAGRAAALGALDDGRALASFAAMVRCQDGAEAVIDDPALLPHAPVATPVAAPASGFVAELDALAIGRAAMRLGAGRVQKGDAVDPAVGVLLAAKRGERVAAGQPLAWLHARSEEAASAVAFEVGEAFTIQTAPPPSRPLILDIVC